MNSEDETKDGELVAHEREETRKHSIIRAIPLDDEAAAQIALALGAEANVAPFRLPSGTVHQIIVPDLTGTPCTMLTIWPSIKRVDAINAAATIVFTQIARIDLVGEIEVQFRRENREYLIVARGGKIIVRA